MLTSFRLVAIIAIANYMVKLSKRDVAKGLLVSLALILGGAIGNAFDSIFYGVLLDNAPDGSPTPWLHGQVIDMLFFPLFEGHFPEWVPFVGGNEFLFFRPVFNLADSFIFIGVALILIRQKVYFKEEFHEKSAAKESANRTDETDTEESAEAEEEKPTPAATDKS